MNNSKIKIKLFAITEEEIVVKLHFKIDKLLYKKKL